VCGEARPCKTGTPRLPFLPSKAYAFSGIDTLMDVAGGYGAVLCEVLSRYPQMKGIPFVMPNVIGHELDL
jgi:hypothetical protein